MKKIIFVLSVLTLPSLAYAQNEKVAKTMTFLSTGAQALDTISTLRASDWQTREANALIPRNTKGLVALKASTAVMNFIGSTRAAKKHPKLVFWLQTSITSGLTYVAYRNTRNK